MPALERIGNREQGIGKRDEGIGSERQGRLFPTPYSLLPKSGYLGVDVGSTSTKAAIIADDGKSVLLKHYLMTAGRPIDAVKELFRELLAAGAGEIAIQGVGVTGSGRYLVGSFIGADLIKNEITAQTRAAADIDPDDDIIEIGGQDSKLVLKRNGVVIDYQMNKACAAGTGSFIDELAEMLGVSVKDGQFAAPGLRGAAHHRPGHPLRRVHGAGRRHGATGRPVAGNHHSQPGGRYCPQLFVEGGWDAQAGAQGDPDRRGVP